MAIEADEETAQAICVSAGITPLGESDNSSVYCDDHGEIYEVRPNVRCCWNPRWGDAVQVPIFLLRIPDNIIHEERESIVKPRDPDYEKVNTAFDNRLLIIILNFKMISINRSSWTKLFFFSFLNSSPSPYWAQTLSGGIGGVSVPCEIIERRRYIPEDAGPNLNPPTQAGSGKTSTSSGWMPDGRIQRYSSRSISIFIILLCTAEISRNPGSRVCHWWFVYIWGSGFTVFSQEIAQNLCPKV